MIHTCRVRATGRWRFREIGQKTVTFLGDGGVALDRWMLAADAAGKRWDASTSGLDDVGVLGSPVGDGSASDHGFSGNTVVAASGVLAEVNLDAADLGRNTLRLACGRIYPGNDNPLQR